MDYKVAYKVDNLISLPDVGDVNLEQRDRHNVGKDKRHETCEQSEKQEPPRVFLHTLKTEQSFCKGSFRSSPRSISTA